MSSDALGRWLFGKMPVLGDFVSRGASQGMRDRIDLWLSEEMSAARGMAGERFDMLFDEAPAWNYVDCDEGGAWSGGALCASQDSVGRRFPLIMAAPAADAGAAAEVSIGCLNAICDAFALCQGADALMACEVRPEPSNWQPSEPEWALLADFGPAVVIPGRFPRGIIATMLEMVQ